MTDMRSGAVLPRDSPALCFGLAEHRPRIISAWETIRKLLHLMDLAEIKAIK
jgi:hypothetical protein